MEQELREKDEAALREQVFRMAREAGFNWPEIYTTTVEERLERFFHLAYAAGAAAEREACAQLCDRMELKQAALSKLTEEERKALDL